MRTQTFTGNQPCQICSCACCKCSSTCVCHTSRACMQVAQAPGSRRVVSTEWTAAGIRAAANASDKAVARTRRRSGLQRHGSVASALEASPWCQLTGNTHANIGSDGATAGACAVSKAHLLFVDPRGPSRSTISFAGHSRAEPVARHASADCTMYVRPCSGGCVSDFMCLQRVLKPCASAGHGLGRVALGYWRRLWGRPPDQSLE